MNLGQTPKLTDVARLAGVSRSTASRALGDYGYCSIEVRRKVQDAADRLGYSADRAASSLRSGRSALVAFLCADISDSFFSTAMRGICDVVEIAGYQVIVLNSRDDITQEVHALRSLASHRIDGLIVSPASVREHEHFSSLVAASVPVVALDRQVPHPSIDSVVTDNRSASHEGVNELIQVGHERIGLVASSQPGESPVLDGRGRSLVVRGPARPSVERTQGYVEALQEAGLSPQRSLMAFPQQDNPESRIAAISTVLRAKPTALFTADSYATKAAFQELSKRGVMIPEQMSLIGFDELDWTTLVTPPLTVVVQPAYEMGMLAARRLMERIQSDGETPGQVLTVPSRFESRGSVAAIRSSVAGVRSNR